MVREHPEAHTLAHAWRLMLQDIPKGEDGWDAPLGQHTYACCLLISRRVRSAWQLQVFLSRCS